MTSPMNLLGNITVNLARGSKEYDISLASGNSAADVTVTAVPSLKKTTVLKDILHIQLP